MQLYTALSLLQLKESCPAPNPQALCSSRLEDFCWVNKLTLLGGIQLISRSGKWCESRLCFGWQPAGPQHQKGDLNSKGSSTVVQQIGQLFWQVPGNDTVYGSSPGQ